MKLLACTLLLLSIACRPGGADHEHLGDAALEKGDAPTALAEYEAAVAAQPGARIYAKEAGAAVRAHSLKEAAEAYEVLLRDVMEGDRALFLREDLVDRAWEIVQPVLDHPSPIIPYTRGSWGPRAADELIAPRRWHVAGDVADE